jgi:hypothetical protein
VSAPLRLASSFLGVVLAAPAVQAQDHAGHGGAAHGTPVGSSPEASDGSEHGHGLYGDYPMTREASGTAWQPDSSPMHGAHQQSGAWTWMTHASVFLVYDDQGGPRGDEDVFSSNSFMVVAQRPWGAGTFGLRGMLSLEPATIGDEGYPLLFQTGETADGTTPLVDTQHPHDLFMELAATYSIPLGEKRSAFLYLGLPGEPALGPPAFMHRFSAMENPEAPLGHHWLDSTHISYGVATVGWIEGDWKLDASLFRGAEPDEDRWDIEEPELDSAAARLTWNPGSDWSLQASFGALDEPEQLEPGVDVDRTTVSAIWAHPFPESLVQATLAYGRNDKRPGGTTDAFLLEGAWKLHDQDTWFARVERVEKDELFAAGDPLAGETFPVGKLSLGYSRELARLGPARIAVGGMGSVHQIDDELEDEYGQTPTSFEIFLRASL